MKPLHLFPNRETIGLRPALRLARAFALAALVACASSTLQAVAAAPKASTEQMAFHPAFRTLKVTHSDGFMAPPVLRLGTDDRLTVSFDELADDRSDLCARLVHCNADWQPSRLLESEYLDGFNFLELEDAAFSSNTFQHFVNYRVEIPSGGLAPMASGNYLLQVFDREEPDEVLLQARFQVLEPLVRINGGVATRTDRGANGRWQQLELEVELGEHRVANPYSDLLLEVLQNGRPDSAHIITNPSATEGKTIRYAHLPGLLFPAMNEFRRFETVRVSSPGMHVDSLSFLDNRHQVYLQEDSRRDTHAYSYDQTQAGRFLVRETNSTDSDLGADYVTVHFLLDYPELIGADIYVEGEFTDRQPRPWSRMQYDFNDRHYHLALPLKQGSYNYQYVVVPRDGGKGDPEPVEGSKYETRNEYWVSLWQRSPGARADRLIGFELLQANP